MINLLQTSCKQLELFDECTNPSIKQKIINSMCHRFLIDEMPKLITHLGDKITPAVADLILNYEPSKVKTWFSSLPQNRSNIVVKEFSGNVILILSEMEMLKRTSFITLDKRTLYTVKLNEDHSGTICLNSVPIGTLSWSDNRLLTLSKRLFFLSNETKEKLTNFIPL